MILFRRFMRLFFHHFYHSLAWTYDPVATLVSLGRWDDWVQSVLPYIQGGNILEIGHGPGHLQVKLMNNNRVIVGLDESIQMSQLARARLLKSGYSHFNLTRGKGEYLPFISDSFDTVVSTFPTEYIFELQTLSEIQRVLHNEGRLIVLPAAWIVGQKVLDRSAAWLFKITGQVPPFPQEVLRQRISPSFEKAGFVPNFIAIELKSSIVLIVIAINST
jgi:ubiquinone/menaquinone biosynthesis C-methylase UbiE